MLKIACLFAISNLYQTQANLANLKQSLAVLAKEVGDQHRHKYDIDRINGYGCWCHFEEHTIGGRGEPVDFVDAECKSLHNSYDCMLKDAADKGNGTVKACKPWEVSYLPIVSETGNTDSENNDCSIANKHLGECAILACTVETAFVKSMMLLFEANEVNQEVHGDLDSAHLAHCKLPKSQREIDFECCGQYPERFPYKALADGKGVAMRLCCKDQLYQRNAQQCCYGDVLRPMSFGVCI